MNWLPQNKKAAICMSIDDIHPQRACQNYDGGGDLENGAIGKVVWLMNRHPQLKISLSVVPDWREIEHTPTRRLLASIPVLRDKFFLAKTIKKGTLRIDKYPDFVEYFNEHPRFEIIPHGLHHCHKGLNIPTEFQNENKEQISKMVKSTFEIFDLAKMKYVRGFLPPAWNMPQNLMDVLVENNVDFFASSRDLKVPISRDAKSYMSGMQDVPLIFPCYANNKKLIHFPCNFQATSRPERAFEILNCGGLLAIKSHIVIGALDSVSDLYMNYLDLLFTKIENEFGESLWWTTMGEISAYIKSHNDEN